ncbi:MAG: pentapeptide repeat-containing protein [Alphaproteobacteria bacterium]|nr:pentapeptide repeat-containing protein [Alphaproteobacteria bacterium]
MIKELKRPSKKTADVKVTDADMVYFSLGLGDSREFILPSQRNDYRSDERAVLVVEAVKAGKRLSNVDFSGINFKGADLSGGYFEGCSFKGAVFYKTNAQTCDFTNCCFDEAYFEDTDLMGCDLTGATFKRAFWKNNNTQKAFLDEDVEKYLTSLEKIIRLIEAGKLDIRMLSKSDLLCLDIRRLDFSNIDLSELDLSVFALDGINLCGTYIDPKQLMSLEGWNSYCLYVRNTNEKTRERLCRQIFLEKENKLNQFRLEQEQNRQKQEIKTKKLKRPIRKEAEKEENRAWGIEKVRSELERMDKIYKMQEAARQAQAEDMHKESKRQRIQKEEMQQAENQRETVVSNNPDKTVELKNALNNETQKSDELLKSVDQTVLSSRPDENLPTGLRVVPTEMLKKVPIVSKTEEVKSKTDILIERQTDKAESKIELNTSDKTGFKPQVIVAHSTEMDKQANRTAQAHQEQQNQIFEQEQLEPETRITDIETDETQQEEESVYLKKTEADEGEETIHDLINAGYTITEIAGIVRDKGPIKVVAQTKGSKPVKSKTKG